MGVDCHEHAFNLGFENNLEDNVSKELFQEFGWVEFLSKFQGFDDQVSLTFARGLKDHMSHVGDLIMEAFEKSIAKEIRLSTEGEHW